MQPLKSSARSAVAPVQLLLVALLALTGCSSVPFEYPKTESHIHAPDPNTATGTLALNWAREHDQKSGFIGLSSGTDALGARLRMMAVAERSIDAQYFILKNDRAGALFVGKILLAADRGVRVRLLIDDIFSPGIDRQLTLLDSHPNIEVRMFNPVSRNSLRYWAYLLDFDRANRRMHNKSFSVDGSMSIVGGRNIGEEYFELKQDVLFDDYEVFAIGPIVEDIGRGFDTFWNSTLSVPVAAFDEKVNPEDLDRWRTYIREKADASANGIYAKAVNSEFLLNIQEGRVTPTAARAVMITDSPEKLLADVGDTELATVAREKGRRFRAAKKEILVVTPYFIPQKAGVELIQELLSRDVRVIIVTNSLASTNHVAVHAHYAKYRERLLRAGAEIYEVRAEFTGEATGWGHSPEMVTLHSKATVIDQQTIFVGSFNFDPRSIKQNTEMGLLIEAGPVGEIFTEHLKKELSRVTYRVELNDNGSLRWTHRDDGKVTVRDKEPQTSWARRFMAAFYRILPIENQL